jgi:hypothetical protein
LSVRDTGFSQKIDRFVICYDDSASFNSDAICARETVLTISIKLRAMVSKYSLVEMGMRDEDIIGFFYVINR